MPKNNQEQIPVYLFLGFLESGKTKFIQETLEDKRFSNGEQTLILVCEEGIEEYDESKFPKKSCNVFHVIEDKEELDIAALAKLAYDTKAERVIVEYNGMWNISDLLGNMPENWVIAQVMFFADATTFMNYNANMRSLVVDKLNLCELTVFNRFDKSMDPNEFHKIVRGVSRRSDICYEYADGKVVFDEIEDPLPFDIEADNIVIKDEDFALFYRDIMEEPEKYDGKTVTFKALAAKNGKFPPYTFAVGRHIMTCCVEDIQYCWLVAQYEKEDFIPRQKHWIMLTAEIKVQRHKLYKGAGPVLTIKNMTDSVMPEREVATFY